MGGWLLVSGLLSRLNGTTLALLLAAAVLSANITPATDDTNLISALLPLRHAVLHTVVDHRFSLIAGVVF